MFRAAIAALILAFAAGPALAQEAPANDGWALGHERELVEFWYKPAAGSGRFARLWARYEFFDEVDGYRSAVHLEEFDCAYGIKRTLQITLYRNPGLVDPISTKKKTSPWRHTKTEETDDESRLVACDDKKPRRPADVAAYAAEMGTQIVWPALEPLGWEELTAGTRDFRLYTKPEPGAPTKVWLRLERPQAVGGVRSQAQLYEADCTARKVRTVQRLTYGANNLKGAATMDAATPDWTDPAPRSTGARALVAVCGAE